MSINLLSLERAKLATPDATAADERTLDVLIAGVSGAIEKYCKRSFALNSYDEAPGVFQPDGRLMLTRFPIQSIEAVRHSPTVVAQVQNSDTTTNQQARLTITSTAVELARIASGVKVVNSLLITTYPTLASMTAAITALGAGWSASVVGSQAGDYGLWSTADLFVPPWTGDAMRGTGSLGCRGINTPLYLHVGECNSYVWDARGWLEILDNGLLPISMWNPLFAESWDRSGQAHFYRVQYTAGYAEIPADVQEAAASWVAALWWQSKRDPLVHSQAVSGSVSTTFIQQASMPALTRELLAPYRIRKV